MSLRAKIEAVIYTAEEPVTLAQLAGVFAPEIPEVAHPETLPEDQPSAVSLLEEGFVEAANLLHPEEDAAQLAFLAGREERQSQDPSADASEEKRVVRLREREVREHLKTLIDSLIEDYAQGDRGMEIREVAGGYRIATKPEYHDAVRAFVKRLKLPIKLSLQALETLAVIAYKQPVTAPEISEIRGVDSGGVLGSLVSRKLITTAGRKQVIGRPILYKTTREFLLRFGLKDLNELPSIEEFEKLAGEIELGEDEAVPGETAAGSSNLPFEHPGEAALEAFEANAGEPGLAVEPIEDLPGTTEVPRIATLGTEEAASPDPAAISSIEVVPATHPTVPLDENGDKTDG